MKVGIKKLVLATTVGLTIMGPGLTAAARAEEQIKPEAELSTSFYSQYIWRGWAYSKDSVVTQPSMTVSYKGFGVNLWGNIDTDQYESGNSAQSSNFNETDLTLSYNGTAGKIGYGGGLIYYGLDGAEDSQELYIFVNYDTTLCPTLTVYKEITGIQGWYANLGVSYSVPLSKDIALDLSASAGYLDDQSNYSQFHDGLLAAAINIPVAEYITITPELSYSFALSGQASDRLKADNLAVINENDDNFIYGGLSASIAF